MKDKAKEDKVDTIKILEAFERVYNGEEPDDILKSLALNNPAGENPEALLKAHKWIWGQKMLIIQRVKEEPCHGQT